MPVLGSPVCEWLQCLAVFQAYWWCLYLALQEVSGCSALLCLNTTDDACLWLSSMWVAAVTCCISNLLMIPVLGSPGSEWLQCLAVFQAYWWCLFLALQRVSGCSALLCFEPIDDTYPWLFRKWVAAVPYCALCLLIMPILPSIVCEWLWCLVVFQAYWCCLSLALQRVSSCSASLLQSYWWCSSSTLQRVSGCCISLSSGLLMMPCVVH